MAHDDKLKVFLHHVAQVCGIPAHKVEEAFEEPSEADGDKAATTEET